jgi:NhaP-type Na+/H+ or K+/H+ antiporter
MAEEANTTVDGIVRSADPLKSGGFEWGLLVLFVGMAIRTATRFIPLHLYRPPYTILVFLAGAASGFLKGNVGEWMDISLENWVDTHPHFILFILVPPLLFESSFNVEFRVFWRLGPSSMLLAGPGVLMGTVMMAAALKPMLSMYTGKHDIDNDGEHDDLSFPWSAAFLVGAMVSATDPVAVTSVLSTLGAPGRLSMLVEGESLLNDATAVMLFLVFQDWVIGTDITFAYLTVKMLRLTVGSVVWGVAMGTFSYYWLRHTQDITIDITLLITSVFAVFYVGEHVLHVSGILALVVYGVFLAKNKTFGMRRHLLAENHAIWEEAAFLSNTFIFALSGLIVQDRVTTINLSTEFTVFYALMSICTYAICSVVRIVVLVVLFPLLRRMGYRLLKTENTIMAFVGLRGAISLSLALLVERNADIPGHIRDIILLQVAGVVTLSLVINGSIVGVIYNWMNVYPENAYKSEVVANALAALKRDTEDTIDDLSQHWLHRRADMALLRNLLPEVDKINLSKAALRWEIMSMQDAWDQHDVDLGKKTDEEIVEALKAAHVVDGDVEHDQLDHALLNHTLKKFSIMVWAAPGRPPFDFPIVNLFWIAVLCGRAGRLNALSGSLLGSPKSQYSPRCKRPRKSRPCILSCSKPLTLDSTSSPRRT